MKIKFIGMVLLSSFIGIVFNPEILAASDSVAILDIEKAKMAETVVAKSEVAPKVAVKTTTPKMTTTKTPVAPKTGVSSDFVEFSWGRQNLKIASSTSVDAGANVMKYGRLIWAHNNTAFNNIKTLKIGDIFTMTLNGVTKKYQVKANPLDKKAGISLKVTGAQTMSDGKTEIATYALTDLGFGGYDIVMMTCAGAGNTSRYVVVADEM